MLIYDSCQSAIQSCMDTKTFAIARLYNGEKTLGIHIHDCYEIYFSISGGEQFLIDNRLYEFQSGDLFFINQFESHYLSKVDQASHERVVISIHPEYLMCLSTPQTDLNHCFTYRDPFIGNRISLTKKERQQFMFYINKLSEEQKFGQDVLDQVTFLELMCFLNSVFLSYCSPKSDLNTIVSPCQCFQIDKVLSYINQHIAEDLSVTTLASHFYLSCSYLHRIFKNTTGTTVNQYITAKRIAKAKALLSNGHSVMETGSLCGFKNYNNFYKAFIRVVGFSPREYIACIRS